MAHRGVAQEKALRLMLRPAADHGVHQDYISDHLELTGERKEEEEEEECSASSQTVGILSNKSREKEEYHSA